MLRNLVTDLFRYERIQTTDCRAKEARREAEKMITLAKRGDLHARRQALAYIKNEDVVSKLFDEIAPVECRYVRLTVLGWPQGQPLSILDFSVFGRATGYSPSQVPVPTPKKMN